MACPGRPFELHPRGFSLVCGKVAVALSFAAVFSSSWRFSRSINRRQKIWRLARFCSLFERKRDPEQNRFTVRAAKKRNSHRQAKQIAHGNGDVWIASHRRRRRTSADI